MKVAVFHTKRYDRNYLEKANESHGLTLKYFEPRLTPNTAALAKGFEAVSVFVHDQVDAEVLNILADGGTKFIALRCAGYNNVDLHKADELGIQVVRVPAYSPYSVAEFTVGLMLSLSRYLHRAYARVREGNFSIDGFVGMELHSKTIGIIATGKIGTLVARIVSSFGSKVLAYDKYPNEECKQLGVEYVASMDEIWKRCDLISLHCPLTPETEHLINEETLEKMKPGVMIINTSRGKLIDTTAAIQGLKKGRIGALGLDVYEEEENLFYEDLSDRVLQDDLIVRLFTFPNVLITSHQAFFTDTALHNIATTTLENLTTLAKHQSCPNEVKP
ncbi:Hydroxyacid dehydrogenase [Planctomycetales bacterium 10988]|nr:Hydroxyacid dehydrogenase [Planctomycetales bacterium 10988]